MATRSDQDIDDDFSDIYKEYTGPLGSAAVNNAQDKGNANKRTHVDSDEEDQRRDPNAVPTDFTSREAKFWEAKSKATERNWKKRKEEEMICKICGESGHFTQGCPSTLGANRKSQDFFERVPAREKHVKALFTEKVIDGIEKDIGCKIKMEEKFIIVSGKDRLILAKGVDAVHKVTKGESDHKGFSGSFKSRSRSPERSPATSRSRASETQRSHPSHPRDTLHYQHKFGGRRDKSMENRVREDPQKFSKGSPQAYSHDGGRSHASHSKSPRRPLYAGNSYGSYDGHDRGASHSRNSGWDVGRPGTDLQSHYQSKYSSAPQTLEDLELVYKRDAMELAKIRDGEEDEENRKHRETIRDMRDNYVKKLDALRSTHTRQWEEFLQLDHQRRQQQAQQQMLVPGFSGYQQHGFSDYNGSSGNPQYAGANLSMDPRSRYPHPVENYHARHNDTYAEFQHRRREDFGKPYNRY